MSWLLLLYWIITIPIKQPIEVSNTIGYDYDIPMENPILLMDTLW